MPKGDFIIEKYFVTFNYFKLDRELSTVKLKNGVSDPQT